MTCRQHSISTSRVGKNSWGSCWHKPISIHFLQFVAVLAVMAICFNLIQFRERKLSYFAWHWRRRSILEFLTTQNEEYSLHLSVIKSLYCNLLIGLGMKTWLLHAIAFSSKLSVYFSIFQHVCGKFPAMRLSGSMQCVRKRIAAFHVPNV